MITKPRKHQTSRLSSLHLTAAVLAAGFAIYAVAIAAIDIVYPLYSVNGLPSLEGVGPRNGAAQMLRAVTGLCDLALAIQIIQRWRRPGRAELRDAVGACLIAVIGVALVIGASSLWDAGLSAQLVGVGQNQLATFILLLLTHTAIHLAKRFLSRVHP